MGCGLRGRCLWVLGPIFLGPGPGLLWSLLLVGLVLSFLLLALAFLGRIRAGGFFSVVLGPPFLLPGISGGLFGSDRRQRKFSALAS